MSNVNNYKFAENLKTFEAKVLMPQRKRVQDAINIMNDPAHQWKDAEQKASGQKQLEVYQAWLQFYEDFYKEGLNLSVQHENLVNLLCKWYEQWRNDISNEGRQEVEIMSMQANMLNDIFSEMFKILQPLNLAGVMPPAALNMK